LLFVSLLEPFEGLVGVAAKSINGRDLERHVVLWPAMSALRIDKLSVERRINGSLAHPGAAPVRLSQSHFSLVSSCISLAPAMLDRYLAA
jgi:hypothetical protein